VVDVGTDLRARTAHSGKKLALLESFNPQGGFPTLGRKLVFVTLSHRDIIYGLWFAGVGATVAIAPST
jgi:hypothetical protein